MANCIEQIAGSIKPNCLKPLAGGYTGRGILIPYSALTAVVQNSENPRIVESLTASVVVEVDNTAVTSAFTGSAKASVADSGRKQVSKTFALRIALRGADNSKEIVEPLLYSPLGFIAVLEKKDKVGDGSFEVVGLQSALKTNDDGLTQNEYENAGDIMVTMSCVEDWYEVALYDTDYQTTLEAFNNLLAQAL